MFNNQGSEYYALSEYAKDRFDNEIYARDISQNEKYLDIGKDEVHEIFAKNNDDNIRYAKNRESHFILPIQSSKPCYYFNADNPLFPRNSSDLEIYAQFNNDEIYPNDGSRDIYLKDSKDNQCYAREKNGQHYFACKNVNGELIQYYAKDSLLNDIPIYDRNGEIIYLINVTHNRPLYEIHQDKEIYLQTDDREIYGKNLQNLPVYAKNKNLSYFASNAKGLPYYANYKKSEFYPKTKNGSQFYKVIGRKEVYANRGDNEQIYAKNKQKDDILAQSENIPYYAQIEKGETYPQLNTGDQYYKIQEATEIPATNSSGVAYYAQTNDQNTFYPMCYYTSPESELDGEVVTLSIPTSGFTAEEVSAD